MNERARLSPYHGSAPDQILELVAKKRTNHAIKYPVLCANLQGIPIRYSLTTIEQRHIQIIDNSFYFILVHALLFTNLSFTCVLIKR